MQFSKSFVLAALPYLALAIPHPRLSSRDTAPANSVSLLGSISQAPMGFLNDGGVAGSNQSSFLFNNAHYWALQRYVYDGFNLPQNNETFADLYNQQDFETVLPNDLGLYDSVASTFVGINEHCSYFWDDTVGQMGLFADTISVLARDAIAQYQIMFTTVQSMAATTDCTSAMYKNDMVNFYQSLKSMNKSSASAFSMCTQIHTQLVEFEGQTIQDQDNVASISSRLNASNPDIANQIASINTQMDNLRAEANAAQALMDKAQHDIDVGPAYAWIWPIGTITYLILRSEWVKEINAASAERQTELAQIAKDQGELATLVSVQQATYDLEAQVSDIQQYIGPAIQLIADAEQAFANMSSAISDILAQIDNEMEMSDYTIQNAFWFATETFAAEINASIADWTVLEQQASAFTTSNRITVVNGTDAGSALYNTTGQQIISQLGPVPTVNA